MAFADSKEVGAFVSFNETEGLWALHESTGQYRAWKHWLSVEFGVRGFGKWIATTYEWPPTSQLGANRYAEYFSKLRDENKNPTPVPRHPNAWDGCIAPADSDRNETYIDAETMRAAYRKYGLSYMLEAAQ